MPSSRWLCPQAGIKLQVSVAAGSYQVLGRAGTPIPFDAQGLRFGETVAADGSTQVVCNHPDGNMFLPTTEDASEGYLYTNFECEPGGVSKIYIRNNGETWDVLEGENVDFSSVMGTWTNCGANVTPWNTGMTAEEYEPVAAVDGWQDNVASMSSTWASRPTPTTMATKWS